MLVEAVILDGQDGLLHHRRDLVQRDGDSVLVVERRECGAGGVDDAGLLGKGLDVELGGQVAERIGALACCQAEGGRDGQGDPGDQLGGQVAERIGALTCCQSEGGRDGQGEPGDQHASKATDTDDQEDAPQRADDRFEAEGRHGSRVKGTVLPTRCADETYTAHGVLSIGCSVIVRATIGAIPLINISLR